MRALMVDTRPDAEAVSTDRERHTDDVVGVDQIVRRGVEIELGEDRPDDIELNAFTGLRSAPAHQAEAVAEPDGCNRGPFTGWLCNRGEGAAKQARKRARLLGIRDDRTEDLVLWEPVHANGFRFMDSRPAPRRLDCLGERRSGEAEEHSRRRCELPPSSLHADLLIERCSFRGEQWSCYYRSRIA